MYILYTQHPYIMYSSPSTDQESQLINIQVMYPTDLHTGNVCFPTPHTS